MAGKYLQLSEIISRKKETEGLLAQEEDKEMSKMARDELVCW